MSAATWVEPGYLLYDRDGRFVAQRLDPRRLELVGDVIPLINNTPRTSEDATRVATGSTTGRIAMLHVDPTLNHVQWVDRTGATRRRLPIAPDLVFAPVLSHDGKRAVLSRLIGRFAFQVLRVDLERGVAATLTDVRDYNVAQCWSPDDRTLAMSSILSGGH